MVTDNTTYKFHPDNTIPTAGWVWVFGSNQAGRHGKGAAKIAHVNFGARYGVGSGRTGDAYAIPTKDKHLNVLSLDAIFVAVDAFLLHAKSHPKTDFFVTRIGCVLAGYSDEQIGPMFATATPNCSLPEGWRHFVDNVRLEQRKAA